MVDIGSVMSNNSETRNVIYDPLPLTNDDYPSNTLYNVPPSPEPRHSTFYTPPMDPAELGSDENAIPLGAAQPRFLGAAFYDPGSPSIRDSFTSSHQTIPGTRSEYNSSLYALNDPQTGRFDGNYHDDPAVMGRTLEEKRAAYTPPKAKSKRKVMIAAIIVALALIIAAVIVPLYFFVLKPSNRTSSSGKAATSSNVPTPTSTSSGNGNTRVTGGNGTLITMDDGTTFTYINSFGGYWYWDENDPFNQGARAQSWSPALNETFNYGVDQIRGSVTRL